MAYLDSPPDHRNKLIVFGVILPTFTLVFELVTGLSAGAFADPVPDLLRLVLVLLVPATAGILLRQRQMGQALGPGMSALAGMALGVAAIYALLYLPLLPIALPGVIVGIGLLALAPLLSLVTLWLFLGSARRSGEIRMRWFWAGFAASATLLLAADMPAAMARVAIDRQQQGDSEGAMRLVRMGASEDWIAEAAQVRHVGFAGVPGLLAAWLTVGAQWEMPRPARELLFLKTGEGVETQPPRVSRGLFGRLDHQWNFDGDLGGELVGGAVNGLSLAASRLDMEVLPDANAAYVEWTAEVANASSQQQEARLTLALPEGAVASRATLWVNGVPREASVATRGEARAAYESVVAQSRDPLLVTTDGSGRLLVQAFPILPGERMRFRVGITAPMQIAADGSRSVGLPAIVGRNFAVADTLRHDIQVEGATETRGLALEHRQGVSGPVLAGRVSDTHLWRRTARVAAPPLEGLVAAAGSLGGIRVRQQIEPEIAKGVAPLILLVDGSRSNRAASQALAKSLDSLAVGFPVGLVVAGEQVQRVPTAPWSPAQKARFLRLLSAQPFEGGHDNVPALLTTLDAGTVLWVHGVQPVRFAASTSELETGLERARGRLPQLVRFQNIAGPAFGLAGQRWMDTARDVAPSEGRTLGLGALLRDLTGADLHWRIRRERLAAGAPPADVRGGAHIVRLWAAGEAGTSRGAARKAAGKQAAALGLVASDTGAVVLETDRETREKGLPEAPSNVPAVPEPATWMMLISGFYLMGWQMRRRRSVAALTMGGRR